MADNKNIARMAAKPNQLAQFVIRKPPRVPDQVIRRFPVMGIWDQDLQNWCEELQKSLGELRLKEKE